MSTGTLQLETPRLVLRPPQPKDFDPYAEYMSDAQSAEYLGGTQPRSVAWRAFLQLAGAWELQGFSMFSLICKETGAWIRRVGPWMPEGWPGPEIGWGIIRSRWNKGYATEAAIASIDWAFDQLGWVEIIHAISPDNGASQSVARKLGSRNRGRGTLPPPREDSVIDIWGQTREEWLSRRGGLRTTNEDV